MNDLPTTGHVPLDEVCPRTGLTPATVRGLLQTFPEIGAITMVGGVRGLEAAALGRLSTAAAARRQGADDDTIRAQLQASRPSAQGAPEAGAPTPNAPGQREAAAALAPDTELQTQAPEEPHRTAPASPREDAGPIEQRLQTLQESLMRSEERRLSDHDRLMTALIRTQQELQHLRYELTTSEPRRGRRSGWFGRRRRG